MIYQQKVLPDKASTSVRTEQRHTLEAKDSSPFVGGHTRMCLSQTRQETKKAAAPGPSGQSPAQGMPRAAGGGWLPGLRAPGKRGLSGRENVIEKLGEGEDERDAFSTRKGQLRSPTASLLVPELPPSCAQPRPWYNPGPRSRWRVKTR